MTIAGRILLVIVLSATLLVAATVTTAAAAIWSAGTIAVQVEEHRGQRVSVHVPATLANLAIDLVPAAIVTDAAGEVESAIGDWRLAWHDCYASLADAPDFVLVEARSGDDFVRVAKQRGRLVVTVHNDRDRVHVAIPLRTLERLLERLDGPS